MWDRANENGWLEPVDDLASLLSPRLLTQIAKGGANPFVGLPAIEALRLKQKFSDNGKRKASEAIERMEPDVRRQELDSFSALIEVFDPIFSRLSASRVWFVPVTFGPGRFAHCGRSFILRRMSPSRLFELEFTKDPRAEINFFSNTPQRFRTASAAI